MKVPFKNWHTREYPSTVIYHPNYKNVNDEGVRNRQREKPKNYEELDVKGAENRYRL